MSAKPNPATDGTFDPEQKYIFNNDTDKKPVFDRPMDSQEIIKFGKVLAKSYKCKSLNEIKFEKIENNVLYYLDCGIGADNKIRWRLIFSINYKGRSGINPDQTIPMDAKK